MNADKMRRQMARNTPDAVWRTFDVESPTIEKDLTEWREHWIRQMQIKHKGKNMHLEVFRSDILDASPRGSVRFQMTAVERKPHGALYARGADAEAEALRPKILSIDEVRASLGLLPPG